MRIELVWLGTVTGILALVYAFIKSRWINKQDPGNEKMKAIGVQTVRISLESTSVPRLKQLNRRIYPHHFVEAMNHLKAAGFAQEQI